MENTVSRNQQGAIWRIPDQVRRMLDISVPVDADLRASQPSSINDRRVIELVGYQPGPGSPSVDSTAKLAA